jgi:hypothetical protein
MYSVRKTTKWHGNTQVHVLLCVLLMTGLLVWQYGRNYLVIFGASSLLHLIIEVGLSLSGMRKGQVYVYGHKLPRAVDCTLRALVEGPAYCVPAFFVADQVVAGQAAFGIGSAAVVVGAVSLSMALADRRDLRRLGPGEEPIFSRRAMTRPGAVMLLALVNTVCLAALFLMPTPYRMHAFLYVIAYSSMVMLFYFINYNLGVRMVETYDHERGEFVKPGPLFQAAGLAYDSGYEMALLISPAYSVPFYLGLFESGLVG